MEPATADHRAKYDVEIHYDVRIPTTDPSVSLSADLYLPVGAAEVPALVSAYPYRKDLLAAQLVGDSFAWFAVRGYAGVLIDIAGTGSSDGVHRPEFHPDEGDDAVAAIEWAARQPWCTGDVGMWGHSYGAYMAFRAASRRPTPLKAILPIQGPIDPSRQVVHPDGSRGDLHSMVFRGGYMLALQLLPSLLNHRSPAERGRWHRRLNGTEPVFMDYARHASRDPAWHDRVVDMASIDVPAFCVGGWLDLHCEGIVSAFEQLTGPKKLLMGPWAHFLPQVSPLEPIDFLPLALRWWDHWLRGVANGVPDDPAVVVRIPGAPKPWRAFDTWPPAKTDREFMSGMDGTLRMAAPGGAQEPVGVYRPDPTVGILGGLWGTTFSGALPPHDHHDDDMRSLAVTTDPVAQDTVLIGRPEVRVRTAPAPADLSPTPPGRLVVRLAHVDSLGRSTFVTAGVLCPDSVADEYRVTLRPTARRIPRGDRIRITISDADFPRLTPLLQARPLEIAGLTVSLPVVADEVGREVDITPAPTSDTAEPPDSGGARAPGHRRRISRDLVADSIEVEVGTVSPPLRTNEGHSFQIDSLFHAGVAKLHPEQAQVEGTYRATVRYTSGEIVEVAVTVRCSRDVLRADGSVLIDGLETFARSWEAPLADTRDPSAIASGT
ncbi:CocE/NonD family hydrolase [Jiangella aurantiaca]|uniref:CocE/NonD family hydrolase n=1 Tax=Jiangella aurantiaca TaxID=2530373 RepID=UPI0013A5DD08|nr:CocE/NonD family hydrolase [Jiangella aurantiaca]